MSYFQNVEKRWRNRLIKDETKNHFKTAIKAKKVLTKKIERFCWENETKTNVFQLCCGKREKITLVTLVWLKNLESYVEMVAGLPRNKQI